MQYIVSLFFIASFFQPLYSYSYVDRLDAIIDEKTAILTNAAYKVDKVTYRIRKNLTTQVSLQEIEDYLDSNYSIAVSFCNEAQLKIREKISQDVVAQQAYQELQFVVCAKLYMHYLECVKQKMFYQAVKNYDALNYWQNEKFYQSQSFFQKSIFRSFSGSSYTDYVMNNIQLLQEITQQTNAFLGLMLHNQQLLQKASTAQEFEKILMEVVRLQDEYLHVENQTYDSCDITTIVQKSIDQSSQFSVHLSTQYGQCQMPLHVVRHWKGYTFTTIAVCAAAFIYLHYGNDIAQRFQELYANHVEKPLHDNWKRLNGYMHEDEDILKISIEAEAKKIAMYGPAKGDETTLHEALVNTCNIVSNGEFSQTFQKIDKKIEEVDQMVDKTKSMIDEANVWHERIQSFKKNHPNMLWGDLYKYFKAMQDPVFPDVYKEGSREYPVVGRVPQILPTWLSGNDPSIPVPDQFSTSTENISSESLRESFRAASGELGQAVQDNNATQPAVPRFNVDDLSWDEKVKLVNENDKIVIANSEKNLSSITGASIRKIEREMQRGQAIVGMMALIPLMTVIGGSMFASKSVYNSVAYQPIRTLVRRLEIYLNEIYYEAVTFDKEGHIYFLTEQLKLNINVLTLNEQKLITADIEALQTPSLDYVQKTNVVQRMYRTYPCLIPARV